MVAGSNPAVPTRKINKDGQKEKLFPALFYFGLSPRRLYMLGVLEGIKRGSL